MLVPLVADDMGIVDSVEVLRANHTDVQNAHRTLDEITMRLFGTCKLLLCLFQSLIVGENALLDLLLTLNKLVLGHDILLGEFVKVDAPVSIII